MQINLQWDARAQAASQSFRDSVQAAANILQLAILNPITVTIQVGYGEYDLNGPAYTVLPANYSLGGINSAASVPYTTLRSALASHATSAAAAAAVNALPDATSVGGKSQFTVSSALAKALGLPFPNAPAVDGYIGLPTNVTGNSLTGLALVEDLHALGLMNLGGDLGLVSYTSPGTHYVPTSSLSFTPAYFSLDGGVTRLATLAVGMDDTLFSDKYGDALNFGTPSTTLSALDLQYIGAAGFNVRATPASPRIFAGYDDTKRQVLVDTSHVYPGPVPGIESEYINVTPDNINVSVGSDNWFVHSGGGNDALAVHGGTNTLDGGTGSNFLVGANGTDTFFVDTRGAAADTWSTAVNFHAGDAATVWGVTKSDFALSWADNQGAAGYLGLTLHAAATGKPTSSITLAGYSTADLANGRLSLLFGNVGGVNYMYLHGER